MSRTTAQTPDAMAFDHYGRQLERTMTKHGGMLPCWPPTGVNIIINAPNALRSTWPRTPVDQNQYTTGPNEVQLATVTVVNDVEMADQDTFVKKMKQLKELFDADVLTQEEYDTKKALLLAKM